MRTSSHARTQNNPLREPWLKTPKQYQLQCMVRTYCEHIRLNMLDQIQVCE